MRKVELRMNEEYKYRMIKSIRKIENTTLQEKKCRMRNGLHNR